MQYMSGLIHIVFCSSANRSLLNLRLSIAGSPLNLFTFFSSAEFQAAGCTGEWSLLFFFVVRGRR